MMRIHHPSKSTWFTMIHHSFEKNKSSLQKFTFMSLGFHPFSRRTAWWLNQPIWKICSSNWIMKPKFRGENKKYLSCRHPENLKQKNKNAESHHHDSGQCFRSSNQKQKSNFLLPLTNHNAQTQAPPVASQFWEFFDLLEDQGSQGVYDEKDLSQEFFNGKTAKHCHFLLAKHRHIHAVIPVFVWWPFLKHYPGPPFSKARHLQVGPAILKFDLL